MGDKSRQLPARIRNDIILAVVLFLLVAVAAVAVILTAEEGEAVVVTVNGEVYSRYSLSEDREVRIKTEYGENLLVIRDGKASVAEANCKDLICKNHRPISKEGETVICLPHKLAVRIEK